MIRAQKHEHHDDDDEVSLELDLSTQFKMDVGWLRPAGTDANTPEPPPMPIDTPVELEREQKSAPRKKAREARRRPQAEPEFTEAELAAFRVYRRRRVLRSAYYALVAVALFSAVLTEVSRQRSEIVDGPKFREALTAQPVR